MTGPSRQTAAILKIEKQPYLGNGSTDQHQIYKLTQTDPTNRIGCQKFEFLQIQDGGRPLFKKCLILNAVCMQPFKLLQQNLAGLPVGPL